MIHIVTNTYQRLDPFFGRSPRPVELDMGCGKGRFTLSLAERYPDRLVLGGDVMLGRLRKVARKAQRAGLTNVELLRAQSLEVLGYQLPDACIRRLHLLCPDPWPKAKHRRHRLVTTDFAVRAARVLEPGGIVHLATDHLPYLEDMQTVFAGTPFFEPCPDALNDVRDLKTDFELGWEAQGKTVPHLAYRRR